MASWQDLGKVIAAHGRQKLWQKSLDLFTEASRTSIEQNVILLNTVLSACQRAAKWQAGLHLAVHAFEWSLQADIISYNTVAVACAACAGTLASSSWQAALSTLMCAQNSLLQLDVRSFTALMQGCIPLGDWQACLDFLRHMLRKKLDVDAFACGAAVAACDLPGQWAWALHLLQSCGAPSFGTDSSDNMAGNAGNWQVPVATTISICGRASKWESSLQLLQDIESAFTPNVVVFSAAISSAEKGSIWQAAGEIMSRMRRSTILANVIVYTTALSGLDKAGKWEMVFNMFAEMVDAHIMPTAVTFDVLLRACQHSPGWEYAFHILDSMMPDFNVSPTLRSINAVLGVLEAELQWSLCIHMLNAASTCDIASYSIVASTCEKSSAWHAAVAICERAEDLRLKSDEVSMGVLISAWEKGRDWQMAINTLMRMLDQLLQPSTIAFAATLRACQACGCWEAALSVLSMVPSPGWTSGLCNPAMGACASGQQWERALSLFVAAHTLQADMVTLTTVMSACEAGLKWQRAISVLNRAVTESLLPDPTALNVAISSCATVQNWWAALALLQSGQRGQREQREQRQQRGQSGMASNIWDAQDEQDVHDIHWPDVVSYNAVLGSCKQVESWHLALELLHDMLQGSLLPDLTSFHGVLEACACGQAWELSLSVLHELQTLELPSGIAINLAASACKEAAKYAKAGALLEAALAQHTFSGDPVTLQVALDVAEAGGAEAGFFGIQAMPCLEALTSWASGQLAMMQKQKQATLPPRLSEMHEAGQAVVAAEILQWHGHMHENFLAQFVRIVGQPAQRELQLLCNPELRCDKHQTRLHNRILERQFGLSPSFCKKVLSFLGMHDPESVEMWLGYPRSATRRCSQHASTSEDPTSKHLAAWASWAFLSSYPTACRARCHGYVASDDAKQSLRPVQVQHDRRPHSERQLLLALAVAVGKTEMTRLAECALHRNVLFEKVLFLSPGFRHNMHPLVWWFAFGSNLSIGLQLWNSM